MGLCEDRLWLLGRIDFLPRPAGVANIDARIPAPRLHFRQRGFHMNMRCLLLSLLTGLTLPAAASQPDGTYECSYEVKARCTTGSASIEFKGGLVRKVVFGNFYCDAEGNPAYGCRLELERGTNEDRWRQFGERTQIDLSKPANRSQSDTVVVAVETNGLRLDLTNTQSTGKCGAAAELPQWVQIERKSKKCKLRL